MLTWPLCKWFAVILATIVASSQASHVSSVLSKDNCVQRSLAHRSYSLPSAVLPSTSEFNLTVVTDLDRAIRDTFDRLRMSEADILLRTRVLTDLLQDLSTRNLTFEAFGSSCNGFGTIASDLDVQITGNITHSEMVPLLTKAFSVQEISEQRPLIVLKHRVTGLMVDMMLNPSDRNHIGLSTWLLRSYSRFDNRAQVLGVFLKAVVKKLKISETRFGDLGSSAYITMLIHYLQQTNPPVLPGITKKKAEASVVRNNATVGQLWLGFLRYYVHEFNYHENIICLHHGHCKTRQEKSWFGPDHNLIFIQGASSEEKDDGFRLAPLMSDYILRVFNQLQTFYFKDNYEGLLIRNKINLDYHPRYGHKRDLVVDTWGYHNRTNCEAVGADWIRRFRPIIYL